MRLLISALLVLLATLPALAQQELAPDMVSKVETFKLKAQLHETQVALIKMEAEKLLLQAQVEGLKLRVEQDQLEAEVVKALGGDPATHSLNWKTLTLEKRRAAGEDVQGPQG